MEDSTDGPLTSEDVRRCADRVRRYWGAHLHVEVVPTEAPNMDWQVVELPPEYQSWSHDRLMQTLLHEWGHRVISPVSPARGAVFRKVAEQEGLSPKQAHTVVNVTTDIWLDRHYLRGEDWNGLYWHGLHQSVRGAIRSSVADPWPAGLFRLYRQLLRETVPSPEHRDKLREETRSWSDEVVSLASDLKETLCDPACPKPKRVRGAARLLQDVLPEEQSVLVSSAHTFSPSGPPSVRLRRRARRAGLEKEDLSDIYDNEDMEALQRRAEQLDLYREVVPVVDEVVGKRRGQGAQGLKTWAAGDPRHQLEAVSSLERSGTLLPGHTTLQSRTHASQKQNAGQGRAVIVVDDSGSTKGKILRREKEAAFAIIAAARRFQDPIGLVTFGSEVTNSIAPTSRYEAVERAVLRLSATSGGTELVPALEKALDHIGTAPKGALTIMTDAWVWDTNAVRSRLEALPSGTTCAAFCFGEKEAAQEAFVGLTDTRVFSGTPDEPFAEAALREIYGRKKS